MEFVEVMELCFCDVEVQNIENVWGKSFEKKLRVSEGVGRRRANYTTK
jgi:hypothetical protein